MVCGHNDAPPIHAREGQRLILRQIGVLREHGEIERALIEMLKHLRRDAAFHVIPQIRGLFAQNLDLPGEILNLV